MRACRILIIRVRGVGIVESLARVALTVYYYINTGIIQ